MPDDSCETAAGSCLNAAKPEDTACDDGNVCTDDACDPALGCVFTNNTAVCDDGDATTCDDVCGAGACAGTPVPKFVPVDESVMLERTPTDATPRWNDAPGPYNVYRGVVTFGSPWQYNHTCVAPETSGSSVVDTELPGAGEMFYYLVSRVDGCRESDLGHDSDGQPVPEGVSCTGSPAD